MKILSQIRDMVREESGATAIEYALILGLVTLAIVGSINDLRGAITDMYNVISEKVIDATNQTTG